MRVCALAGGVGGAKLAAGLQDALAPGDLSVVVNTADDFDPWGLRVCPDLDTVMYTLAGVANPETGWGLAGESFAFLGMLSGYGEDAWFKLGDRDLATHVLRTQRLREGETLTDATRGLARALGVPGEILPMCDEKVSTMLKTPAGLLEFQEYFVRRRQRDEVLGVDLVGIEDARPTGAVLEAVSGADRRARRTGCSPLWATRSPPPVWPPSTRGSSTAWSWTGPTRGRGRRSRASA